MPETPPEALAAAESAIRAELSSSREVEPDALARAALEAAAPILAEATAQKILAHAERQFPKNDPAKVPGRPDVWRTWHRHFGIAARIAAGAFDTREDQLRMAGDIPETPAEPRLISEPTAEDEPWWCDCRDRKGPHVHMPNWSGQGGSIALTALVDIETGLEIPGSRKAGGG